MCLAESNRKLSTCIVYNVYEYIICIWYSWGEDIGRVCYSLVFRKRGHRSMDSALDSALKDRHHITLIRIFRYSVAKSQCIIIIL